MCRKIIKLLLLTGFYQLNYAASAYLAGTLDTTFNATGGQPGTLQTYINNQPDNSSQSNTVLVQPDGKIVASGYNYGTEFEFAIARFNYDGSLDSTFNAGGSQPGTIELANLGGNITDNQVWGSVLQSDGKIIVAGQTQDTGVSSVAIALARFNTNGALDTTFNPTGVNPGTVVISNINGNTQQNYAHQVALQADQKLVVVGPAFQSFGVARLNVNGRLDTTFNPTGSTPGTFSLNTFNGTSGISIGYSVAIQNDQKIVVAGTNGISIALARLNTDGSLDTSFNATGVQPGTVVLSDIDGNTINNGARTVLIQTNGKIIVIGTSELPPRRSIPSSAVALACFNPDGTLDTTFNASGTNPGTFAVYDVNGNYQNIGLGATLQVDQKIVIATGVVTVRTPADPGLFGIVRVNSDGSLDTTFNPDGIAPGTASVTVCNHDMNQSTAVALQNINLILAGTTLNPDTSVYEFGLARFLGTTISDTFALRLIEKYS